MFTKQEKTELFNEHRYYIDYIVFSYLSEHPSFYYLKEDLQAECYLKFVEIVDDFDGEKAKFTTFLYGRLSGYLSHYVRKEIVNMRKRDRYKEEHGDEEASYEMHDPFLELIEDAGLTEREQYCLKEKFQFDKTHGEIAETLGVSRQMVDKIIKQCYSKISATYDT